MDATISAIVRASELPLSILIVGVGNADFSAMNTLVRPSVRPSVPSLHRYSNPHITGNRLHLYLHLRTFHRTPNPQDGDDVRLSNASGTARRDIVQFVELKEFVDARTGAIDRARLARALLDEIPGQLLSYMAMHGVPPNPPRGDSIPIACRS